MIKKQVTFGRASLNKDSSGLWITNKLSDGFLMRLVSQSCLKSWRRNCIFLQTNGNGPPQILEEMVDICQSHLDLGWVAHVRNFCHFTTHPVLFSALKIMKTVLS